ELTVRALRALHLELRVRNLLLGVREHARVVRELIWPVTEREQARDVRAECGDFFAQEIEILLRLPDPLLVRLRGMLPRPFVLRRLLAVRRRRSGRQINRRGKARR